MMFCVGLTGGIGSGKSVVAAAFAELGVPIVDADQIAHRLTQANGIAIPQLVLEFGRDVLDQFGALDRLAMRRLVFDQPEKRKALESILHPLIRNTILSDIEKLDAAYVKYCIIDIPLLFESNHWRSLLSRVLVVDCPESLQISRVMARNQWSEHQVKQIMAAQVPRSVRLAGADDVICNEGAVSVLAAPVLMLHEQYLRLASLV